MTQIATVTALEDTGFAVVTVARKTACGHDCENCAGCGAQGGSISVRASTDIPVKEGDRVEIYSSRKVLGVAALVYLVPLVLFLAGYVLTPGYAESVRYICAGAGFVLGIAAAVAFDRRLQRRQTITYHIIRKL